MTFNLWEGRNKQLHETKHIEDMQGAEILKESIQKEYNKGIGRLPASDYSYLFKHPCKELLMKPLDILMNWFLTVRQARILMDTDNLVIDEFTTSTTLQKWIGISYGLTDQEGRETLLEAVIAEFNVGPGQLPQHLHRWFETTKESLTERSTSQLKIWFKHIRTARQQYDHNNYTQDEFTHPGAYRDWAGL